MTEDRRKAYRRQLDGAAARRESMYQQWLDNPDLSLGELGNQFGFPSCVAGNEIIRAGANADEVAARERRLAGLPELVDIGEFADDGSPVRRAVEGYAGEPWLYERRKHDRRAKRQSASRGSSRLPPLGLQMDSAYKLHVGFCWMWPPHDRAA